MIMFPKLNTLMEELSELTNTNPIAINFFDNDSDLMISLIFVNDDELNK